MTLVKVSVGCVIAPRDAQSSTMLLLAGVEDGEADNGVS